jgi:hypothetical protein
MLFPRISVEIGEVCADEVHSRRGQLELVLFLDERLHDRSRIEEHVIGRRFLGFTDW